MYLIDEMQFIIQFLYVKVNISKFLSYQWVWWESGEDIVLHNVSVL